MAHMVLSKWEKKFLRALERYPNADIGMAELHGYLHFPPIEVTLSAIGGLEQKGYVTKKGAPWHGYQIEAPGRKYLESKKPTLLIAPQIISIVTAVIGGVLVALIIHLLGVS